MGLQERLEGFIGCFGVEKAKGDGEEKYQCCVKVPSLSPSFVLGD